MKRKRAVKYKVGDHVRFKEWDIWKDILPSGAKSNRKITRLAGKMVRISAIVEHDDYYKVTYKGKSAGDLMFWDEDFTENDVTAKVIERLKGVV